ncbi:MAG: bifunctional 4-hydroxy-3-methylbut-2-enyl diphosphate reductase/30S ribosomal protein S1, partial [Clostridiales Family XIII bacterium]|nr:bifunctional 4-hydroxy-3-methylbut-2-enyl diphosphate reductase/30S ribosomal protein S1 [Clostridiales Family XIII bacterium]
MEILRAKHMGFCGGVDRAVRLAEEAAPCHSVGAIIHNDGVMRGLAEKGLTVAESLDEVPDGATVVVRSHGEGPAFFEEAAARGLMVVDATCPKVKRIHELVAEAAARGERVVVVGDPLHPEVRATVAWAAPAEVTVVQT